MSNETEERLFESSENVVIADQLTAFCSTTEWKPTYTNSSGLKTFPEATMQLRLLEDRINEKKLQQLHIMRFADGVESHREWIDVPVVSKEAIYPIKGS